jgi:hypothetical protein
MILASMDIKLYQGSFLDQRNLIKIEAVELYRTFRPGEWLSKSPSHASKPSARQH